MVSSHCTTIAKFKDKPSLDGVLGGPVFKTLDVVIDYKKTTLTLSTADTLDNAEPEVGQVSSEAAPGASPGEPST